VGGLLKRSSSTASRSVDLGATGASSASAAHHQRFMPRAASALDTVNPRSSSEGHEGSRRAATVQGLRPTSLAETAAAHDLGSMGGRCLRTLQALNAGMRSLVNSCDFV
jgi:hypothetical protein